MAGACRRDDLVKMTVDDIDDKDPILLINIPNSKTYISRQFIVTNGTQNELQLVRKYLQLRPENCSSRRLFIRYQKGKCVNQVVGMNTMGNIPGLIANFLKLPNPNCYTGHCFRRTSATLLADAGGDITTLKRHGGWRSATVAEGYIENSVENKIKISKQIMGEQTFTVVEEHKEDTIEMMGAQEASSSSKSHHHELTNSLLEGGINFNNLNNCQITINYKK